MSFLEIRFSVLIELGLLAFLASFCVSLLIIVSRSWHGRFSNDHDLDGVQKVHTAAVPRIGGVAVLLGIVTGLVMFAWLRPEILDSRTSDKVLALIAVAAPAFLAGFLEDVTKKVSVKVRLLATILSPILASWALNATITRINIWGIDLLLMFVPLAVCFTALAVAGVANAINIIDGFNGLSSGAVILIASGLSFVAWQNNDGFVLLLGALCIGATLGFFVFNYPMGKLLLGDGGAYLLGFLLAEMAVLLARNPQVNVWKLLGICAYPVIEVMFSMYRRKYIKKVSPSAADALHLHTLVYRRVVFAAIPKSAQRPWVRNAGVALYILPVVACCVAASALYGGHMAVAFSFIVVQSLIYVVAYRRLVLGRRNGPRLRGYGGRPEAPQQR